VAEAEARVTSLAPYQQRVVDERHELDEKRRKLAAFVETPTFHALPADEQTRMLLQAHFMELYSWTLGERIQHFVVDPAVDRSRSTPE
jgi:hypothetical protein